MKKSVIWGIMCLFLLSGCSSSTILAPSQTAGPVPIYEEQPGLEMQQEYTQSRGQICSWKGVTYFLVNQWLYYYDEASGISGKLCGKPECDHNNHNCNAHVNGIGGVQVYDGRIYYVMSEGSLYRMDLEGKKREPVMALRNLNGGNGRWVIHRGNVFSSVVKTVVEKGEGRENFTLYRHKLGESGKGELILEKSFTMMPQDYWQILGDRLYLVLDEHGMRLKDFYRYDIQSGELNTVLTGKSDWVTMDMRVDPEGVSFLDKKVMKDWIRIVRYDFQTEGMEEIFTLNSPLIGQLSPEADRMILYEQDVAQDETDRRYYYQIIDRQNTQLAEGSVSCEPREFGLMRSGSDEYGFLFYKSINNEPVHTRQLLRISYTGEVKVLIEDVRFIS